MTIRWLVLASLLFIPTVLSGCRSESIDPLPPNIVIIFADDLGYGDLSTYGHPTIRTPGLDRMAAEGMRFTQFYSAASVCTPSRAALLTGRLPIRSGMAGDRERVLFPDSDLGLAEDEVTIAEVLRASGYATAAIGKWHLGHRPEYLPTRQGFDTYFGIPYSNDMDKAGDIPASERFGNPRIEYFNVPLMRDEEIVERPADQTTITRRYAEEAVQFIEDHRDRPFFVYLAHNLPHVPLFRSDEFAGTSRRGLFGDVVEEIDWSVGFILDTLRRLDIDRRTLVVFTSDNGPWLAYGPQGGSAGLLRGGKGMTWEGGMREPAVFWWPGTIPAGRVQDAIASTMDLLPTAAAAAGAELPDDRVLDGQSILPVLEGVDPGPDRPFFFYRGTRLTSVRKGPWKAHFVTEWAYRRDNERAEHDPPLLFNLEIDPGESYNVASDHPDIVASLTRIARDHVAANPPAASRLEARSGTH